MALSALDAETRAGLSDPDGEARLGAIRDTHIPAARDELAALLAATGSATEEILGAAERIAALAEGMDDGLADRVASLVTDIYQACGFQDIAGQRITKVGTTLDRIESASDCVMAAHGDESARRRVEERRARAAVEAADWDEDAALLHGPQLEGGGNNQDDIDKILAGFD